MKFKSKLPLLCLFALIPCFSGTCEESVSFLRQVAPILRDKCLTCHGPEKAKGEYRIDNFELMNKPGSSKVTPLVSGAPEKSHLYQLLTATDEDDRMPQKDDPLPKEHIAVFARWIREGAKFDGPDTKATLGSLAGLVDQPPAPETYAIPVPITALAFHPEGKELAVGGYHEITIWSAENGTLLRRITNVAQRTVGLAYSPDGSVLATASGTPGKLGETKLFDPATGARIRTLVTAPDLILAVAFNHDATRIACAGTDNTIRILATATGKLQLTIEQHADWVTAVAFSPDGSNIVSASRDKTARVFDSTTGELDSTYIGHTEGVFAAAFAHDGKRVITGGRDRELHVWEIKDAKKTAQIAVEGEILRALASTNGFFVAAENAVRQYSSDKRDLVRTFSGHSELIYSIALHEPSARLASASYDGEVRIWNMREGTLLRKFTAAPMRLTAR
jgi:hypothetical protein